MTTATILRLVPASHFIRPASARLTLRAYAPIVEIRPIEKPVRKRRQLSQTPTAIRKRRSRKKREIGLRSYKLYLPVAELMEAVRKREDLPADATPTRQQVQRTLDEGFAVQGFHLWSRGWVRLQRHK